MVSTPKVLSLLQVGLELYYARFKQCMLCGSRKPYQGLVGGVLAMPPHQVRMCNGYSNSFYGWGAEDDSMYER